METTDVFRVEHRETGKGPYSGPFSLYSSKLPTMNWPMLRADPKIKMTHDEAAERMHPVLNSQALYYGFPNRSAFRAWFGSKSMRKRLAQEGLVIRQYRVHRSAVKHGKTQSVFVKDAARVVAEYSPLTFGKRSG